jgi:hypothetical protein
MRFELVSPNRHLEVNFMTVISELKLAIEPWEKKNLARTESLPKTDPHSVSNKKSGNFR